MPAWIDILLVFLAKIAPNGTNLIPDCTKLGRFTETEEVSIETHAVSAGEQTVTYTGHQSDNDPDATDEALA